MRWYPYQLVQTDQWGKVGFTQLSSGLRIPLCGLLRVRPFSYCHCPAGASMHSNSNPREMERRQLQWWPWYPSFDLNHRFLTSSPTTSDLTPLLVSQSLLPHPPKAFQHSQQSGLSAVSLFPNVTSRPTRASPSFQSVQMAQKPSDIVACSTTGRLKIQNFGVSSTMDFGGLSDVPRNRYGFVVGISILGAQITTIRLIEN